ncbi:helix-turn-helix transcriptional regulator [Streptomyces mirabilis]|uniref:helix-turn-helix transcriptional regulator n=1 Tax=Streptomyces mirabilis TaxID=68239 RepID=UPI0021BF1CC5|nr:helix-turn-helix transcriptional regulator [Streptomyces mirabilis]MCT9107592.1 helix-turn-helix transcriptional regulator [Streptomyces mirabilis]
MPVRIPDAAALTQLTPAEKQVAEVLVTGASNIQGAQRLKMRTSTFAIHLGSIGRKFQINGKAGRPARAHAVLASGQVAPPSAPADVPEFTPAERQLLQALAEHAETDDIGKAANVALPADVRPLIAKLVDKAGADNDTHLIGLGHAWGLLGAGTTGTRSGSSEPVGEAR